jgi:poly-gamma-glutamate synthesis protein (capsule biosynthesis protein)
MKFVAVGDICFGDHFFSMGHGPRSVLERMGPSEVFHPARDFIADSDVVFCNLECPISDFGLDESNYSAYAFRGQPESASALRDAGFNLVNIANNHILQHGEGAYKDSIDILTKHGLRILGESGSDLSSIPVYYKIGGTCYAVIGYSHVADQSNPAQKKYAISDLETIRSDIAILKKTCDVVIVSLHYGKEALNRKSWEEERTAKSIIDFGADVFLGHHSHVFYDIDIYKGRVIIYSLGNFVFDLLWDNRLRLTAIVKIEFDGGKAVGIAIKPMIIGNHCYPENLILDSEYVQSQFLRREDDGSL